MYKERAEVIKLHKIHSVCLDNNLIFASYRYPHDDRIHTIIQTGPDTGIVKDYKKISSCKGFIFSPFRVTDNKPIYIIRPDYFFTDDEVNDELMNELCKRSGRNGNSLNGKHEYEISRSDYLSQVDKAVREIRKGSFEKVVLSRLIIFEGQYMNETPEIFHLMCKLYPNAFVFMVKIDEQFWLGASPELLLKVDNGSVHTVSLAGTKQYEKDLLDIKNWNEKERKEQEYVTRFIEKTLKEFHINDFHKTGPYPKRAGHLLHLRTDISFSSSDIWSKIGELVDSLHPTPAVCGISKTESQNYIVTREKHSRDYYSGILGVVNMDEKLALYVNLRSVRILRNRLQIYVGGGITSQSKPEEEWDETNSKAQTILAVLNQIKSF